MIRKRLAYAVLLCAAFFSPLLQAQTNNAPAWTPPPARKGKAWFAPKPTNGHNIFQGPADAWLTEVLEDSSSLGTPLDDQATNDYVAQVGTYLAAHSVKPERKYRFIVTDDEEPNAFTIGGGRIYITRGLLSLLESEDELAGVLAHEIGHDAFSHIPKTLSRQMFWLTHTKKVQSRAEIETALTRLYDEYAKNSFAALGENLLGFARFDELEADRAAFHNTYRAGYNPVALAAALKHLARHSEQTVGRKEYRREEFYALFLGTHPPSSQRTLALAWESNFVKMPDKKAAYANPAFAAMKQRLAP